MSIIVGDIMFVPHEITIIGTMIHKHKNNVSYKEVQEYIKRRGFNIELENDFEHFEFINKTDNGFHIDRIPPMHPAMIQFLMQ